MLGSKTMGEAVAIPMTHGLLLAAMLFSIGLLGVLVRRNIILILMSLEVMLNACGLAFIVAGAHWGIADGQIMFMFILSIAAAEVSIALGLLLQVHRRFRSLVIDQASGMRG
jgi:NADH-quinone oxidoreductase subunit K